MTEDRLPEIVAILIHWGDADVTLASAEQHVRSGAFDRVVVVANDRTPVPDTPGDVTWLVPQRNLGYGAGCQFGAEHVPANNYAFLNADVELDRDAATLCLAALRDDDFDIVGPVLVHRDGTLQSGCGSWSRYLQAPRVRQWPSSRITACQWVTGAALFCRGPIISGERFDGSYFLGYEDSDLCERVAKAGGRIGVVQSARGVHEGGGTMPSDRWQYYSLRNRVWFVRRHRKKVQVVALLPWLCFALIPRIFVADVALRRGFRRTLCALHAVLDGFGPMPSDYAPWPREPVPERWLTW